MKIENTFKNQTSFKTNNCILKKSVLLILVFFPLFQFSQDFSDSWNGHFSYYNIKEVVKGNDKIFAAGENTVFSVDLQTDDINEITTVDGLSGELISTIYYSTFYELLIIGYENGLIEIKFDNDDEVLTVVDIINKLTIPSEDRRINHFYANENVIYISTNYGISVFDLERLEFGDTYFIGNGGAQIPVKQVSVYNGNIYAACQDNNGLKKASLTGSNLIDYRNWQTVVTGDFAAINTVDNRLYTARTNRKIYEVVNDVLNELFTYDSQIINVISVSNMLLVATSSNVFVYDSGFNLVFQTSVGDTGFATQFSSISINSNTVFIGTKDLGVLKVNIENPMAFEEVRPDGPLLNRVFKIRSFNGELWMVSGGYSRFYNFGGGIIFSGISHLKQGEWLNIPYDSISAKIENPRNLSHIAINPLNPNQVFISSYFSGLIEINDNEIVGLYDETNSTLEPFASNINLTLSGTYDSNGALWLMNGRVQRPLNKFVNGQWTSYGLEEIIPTTDDDRGFSDVIIDSDGTKFIGSHFNGVIAFNENNGNQLMNNISDETQNMPTFDIKALALDKRNQLWIGTPSGLRVLFNTSNFLQDDNPRAEEIIIEEDGVARELFDEQFISDIKVDGSNNKWVATIGAGVFYLSSDGQKTIFHFTTDNSPLPSNDVNDISIDDTNGLVYIGTENGLVSYKSGSTTTREDFSKSYAYPNPVRPGFDIVEEKVKIRDLPENVNIKITDIEGNLVAEAQSRTNQRYQGYNLEVDGGIAYWNGKNLANNIVASGVYLIMLSDLDSFETKVIKLMVVR